MKQPKKPTRNQKEIMRKNGLNERDFMVLQDGPFSFTVIAKEEDEHGRRKECILPYSFRR